MELRGFTLCRRCLHEEECRPFRDVVEGAALEVERLRAASGRRFGLYTLEAVTLECLSPRRRRPDEL